MGQLSRVCVFCGSSSGIGDGYLGLARELGWLLADRDIGLVYGGARVGLMGEVADACMAEGGHVTGVLPVGLFSREVPHSGLSTLHEVPSMHERKQLMYDLSDGFVALPGGLGTLEELAEVATWSQLGLHSKPVVLLDVDGFWDPLVDQLDRMVDLAFLKAVNRRLIQRSDSPERALDLLAATELEPTEKWITPDER
jgi:uncharacterized protein (TIGR00730 family)